MNDVRWLWPRVCLAVCAVLGAGSCTTAPSEQQPRSETSPESSRELGPDAAPRAFATVVHDAKRPYIWPLLGPGDVEVTRAFPMAERDGESQDHPHHQSLWLAHGDVNGFDFWHGSKRGEHQRCVRSSERLLAAEGHAAGGHVYEADYEWTLADGSVQLHETRIWTTIDHGTWRSVAVQSTLRAGELPVVFGDTKEGMFAVRVRPELRCEGPRATAGLRNSEGHQDGDVWGKRARWIDSTGTVDGQPFGVAMFDHPSNLRHPTWWHARRYGLLAANPFGVHDFERKPKGAGDFTLAAGKALVQRYLIVLHPGFDEDRLEQLYQEFGSAVDEPLR
ncbi:MAG: PmoA family protein [Planctomycetota bacterium]